MKSLIIDMTGLAGFGLLMAGIYLRYGTAAALISGGSGLLIWAILAAWRTKRVS